MKIYIFQRFNQHTNTIMHVGAIYLENSGLKSNLGVSQVNQLSTYQENCTDRDR